MVDTENITAANPCSRSGRATALRERGSLHHISLAVFIAAVSVFVLFLAWPRLHASILYLPVDTAIANYYKTRQIPVDQLSGLQERARQCIEILPHYRYQEGLSLLYYMQAVNSRNLLHDRREAFIQSIEAAEASLSRAPAQPRTWLRMAQARAWLRYFPDEVIAALKMSIYTGRVEPSLFMTRLALGLSYLPRMGGEGAALIRDQVLLAWQLQPREFTKSLKNGKFRFSGIETLLSPAHSDVLSEIRESAGGAVK